MSELHSDDFEVMFMITYLCIIMSCCDVSGIRDKVYNTNVKSVVYYRCIPSALLFLMGL